MNAFYGKLSICLVFWLLLSQTLSVFAQTSDGSETGVHAEVNQDDVEGAEGRSFSDFFNYMSRSENQETGRLNKPGIFNTTVAFTVPLFSFTLPDRESSGGSYTKEAALALIGLALVAGLQIIPFVWALLRSGVTGTGRSLSGSSKDEKEASASYTILSAITDMAARSGLGPEQCFLRSLCEANQEPEKFGMITLPLRLFFRPSTARDGEPMTVYQEAAQYGSDKQNICYQRYLCSFSLLEAVNYLIHYFSAPGN